MPDMGGRAIRGPRRTIALWLLALTLLGALGAGVEQRLTRGDIDVPGTGAAKARELARKHFGDSDTLVILLEGPRAQTDVQGRRLAATLERQPDFAVAGPWSRGA